VTDEHGGKQWFIHDKLHRDEKGNVLPAYIDDEGCLQWCQHGVLHRTGDLPAFIESVNNG